MKSKTAVLIVIFKTPVSQEQALNLQEKIDATQKELTDIEAMGESAPEDVKSKIPKVKSRRDAPKCK